MCVFSNITKNVYYGVRNWRNLVSLTNVFEAKVGTLGVRFFVSVSYLHTIQRKTFYFPKCSRRIFYISALVKCRLFLRHNPRSKIQSSCKIFCLSFIYGISPSDEHMLSGRNSLVIEPKR